MRNQPFLKRALARIVTACLTGALAACAGSPTVADGGDSTVTPRGVPIPDTGMQPGSRYTAVYLAPYPQPSGCDTEACQLLDRMEREGFEAARSGVVSWVAFVTWYYEQRARIYPESDDSLEVNEMRKLQLQLARRLDLNLITEDEWVAQLQAKLAEIRAAR